MPERRSTARPDSPDRRSFPRPPLWLTVGLLLAAVAALFLARWHRSSLDARLGRSLAGTSGISEEMRRMRQQIASMDLTEDALRKEVDARMKLAESLDSNEFYIAIDTQHRKFRFHYGNDVVREADVVIGDPREIRSKDGRARWTFPPLRGAFQVVGKATGYESAVPGWVYLLGGQEIPADRPVMSNWLGKYVILLPNGYALHSPPPPESPLKGAKPGSFMVPEEDLRAIWPRINAGTKVFVF